MILNETSLGIDFTSIKARVAVEDLSNKEIQTLRKYLLELRSLLPTQSKISFTLGQKDLKWKGHLKITSPQKELTFSTLRSAHNKDVLLKTLEKDFSRKLKDWHKKRSVLVASLGQAVGYSPTI